MAVNISSIARNIVNFIGDHFPGISDVAGRVLRVHGEVGGRVSGLLQHRNTLIRCTVFETVFTGQCDQILQNKRKQVVKTNENKKNIKKLRNTLARKDI